MSRRTEQGATLSDFSTSQSAIDATLHDAVDDGNVLGVAGAAWTRDDLIYEGAAGDAVPGRAMVPDTVVWIASMTKALTATAALQLMESGAINLDTPAGEFVDYLSDVAVLDGFDDEGRPRLRAPRAPVTIRHLLTHTSGFAYDFTNEEMARCVATQPASPPGSQLAMQQPLAHDPGDRWTYGIGTDWLGRVVEAVAGERLDEYFAHHVTGPLSMVDTHFALTDEQHLRVADVNLRADGQLVSIPLKLPEDPEMLSGGGGLYSTVRDYARFTRMLLNEGSLEGVRVLAPASVALMCENHIGELEAHGWTSQNRVLSSDVSFLPEQRTGWGLAALRNTEYTAQGRSPGSMFWGGLANSYYWIDQEQGVTGVFVTQVLPFGDAGVLGAFSDFERAIYDALR